MISPTPKVLTEADLAGLPRAVSGEDALIERLNDECDLCNNEGAEDIATLLAEAIGGIRALVSERDALAGRVRELEAERDRLTLSRIDRECLRIGQEIQRAAGELPYGYEIEIEVEHGSGSVYLSKPDYSKVSFHDMVDGLSYAITEAIDAALSATTPESKP